jgi:ribosome-associated protein
VLRQLRAIADAIEESLHKHGRHLSHREGRAGAEWLLLDYGNFIAHIFSERAREYYDLERLWRNGERLDLSEASPNRISSGESEASAARG